MKKNRLFLKTSPLAFIRYEVCTLRSACNAHTSLTLKGLIGENQIQPFLLSMEQKLVLQYVNDDVEIEWEGIIQEVKIDRRHDETHAEVVVYGLTLLADQMAHTRTFPPTVQTLNELVRAMDSPHLKKVKGAFSEKALLKPYTMQYEETDWAFVLRILSEYHEPLIIDDLGGLTEVYAGISQEPLHYSFQLYDSISMTDKRMQIKTLPIANKYYARRAEASFLAIGTSIKIDEVSFYVTGITYELADFDALQVVYELVRAEHFTVEKLLHPVRGATLKGRVVETNDPQRLGRIVVQYDWEQREDVLGRWFDWLTPYAGNEVGIYVIPEIGEQVIVHYLQDELDCYVDRSVRTKPLMEEQVQSQYWRTADGAEIELGKQTLKLSLVMDTPNHFTMKQDGIALQFAKKQVSLTDQHIHVEDEHQTMDLTQDSAVIQRDQAKVRLTDHEIVLQVGETLLKLDDKGLSLQANTVHVESQQLQVKASEDASMEAASLNVQTSQKATVEAAELRLASKGKTTMKASEIQLNNSVKIK